MNILLIGNGFDIAHGFPTTYANFLDFVSVVTHIGDKSYWKTEYNLWNNLNEKIKALLINKFRILYDDPSFTSLDIITLTSKRDVWEKLVTNNLWIEYFKANRDYLGENWIDFESEISIVIREIENSIEVRSFSIFDVELFSNMKKIDYNSKRNFYSLRCTYLNKEKPFNNINSFVNSLEDDLDNLIQSLDKYISEYINELSIDKYSEDIANLQIDKVISFNYSNTYERLYGADSGLRKYFDYDYIHGKADEFSADSKSRIVLGINEYLSDEDKNKKIRFIKFKKYFQRIHKYTGNQYIKWIENIENDDRVVKHNVYIFGHSLDETDKDILNRLICHKKIYTNIYYHNRKAYGQQIANLVKVIGQDNLITKTGGSTQSISFIEHNEEAMRDI